MSTLIFSLAISTAVLMAGYVQFCASSLALLKRDFSRESETNAKTACLVYGDMLARTNAIVYPPAPPILASAKLDLACLMTEGGTCIEKLTCDISITAGGAINATVK